MNLQCAACQKKIYSIDQIFQLYSKECKVSNEDIGFNSATPKPSACYQYFLGFYRHLRSNSIYRTYTHSSIVYTYYCASCGPHFKDATPYFGPTIIKHQICDFVAERCLVPDSTELSQSAKAKYKKNHAEFNRTSSLMIEPGDKVRVSSAPPYLGIASQGMARDSFLEQARLMPQANAGGVSPPKSYGSMVSIDLVGSSRAPSQESIAMTGSFSSIDSEQESPLELASSFGQTDFSPDEISPFTIAEERPQNDRTQLSGFESANATKIWQEVKDGANHYDDDLANADYPPLFMALHILSKSFRDFVANAIAKNNSFTRQLYKETTGVLNPSTIIGKWLVEAQATFDGLERCREYAGPSLKHSFYLHRIPQLTVPAIESLLVEASSSYLPRPTYTRKTMLLLMCMAFLGVLGFIIASMTSKNKGEHHLTTPRNNHTTTPATTPTTTLLPVNPCNMPEGCVREVYQQVVDNLDWFLLQGGFTTVGQIYDECRVDTVFVYFLEYCFSTDPDFSGMLQRKTQISIIKEFFERQL